MSNETSRDEVQAALAGMASKEDAIAVMQRVGGVRKLSELDADKFGAVIEAALAAKAHARPKTMAELDAKAIYERWNSARAKSATEGSA